MLNIDGRWGVRRRGSTPTCRGYDHFNGFYSAASDYYTHTVGAGYDYRFDFNTDFNASGVYTTEKVTSAVQAWIHNEVATAVATNGAAAAAADLKTFAMVMHEAVHGPLEAPMHFIDGACRALVPEDHPSRLVYCGMVRAMDESVGNITQTYKDLNLWDSTLVIMSADNGGNPGDGGSNFPLRGNKATTWEGGVRGLGWIYGAGLTAAVQGTVTHDIMHVTDWLPTLVAGVAGVELDAGGRPCASCNRTLAPFDGVNQWKMLSEGAASARTEVLLDLQTTSCWNLPGPTQTPCNVPGSGALRVGKWKLLHGHTAVWSKVAPGGVGGMTAAYCALRNGMAAGGHPTLPITAETSPPWCANGWTPPPQTTGYESPTPPPDSGCTGLPCTLNQTTSPYLTGGTFLFDVVNDPFEHNDVAAANPTVVATLLARLSQINSTHCGGNRCEPVVSLGPKGTPTNTTTQPQPDAPPPPPSGTSTLVWTPWRGDPIPAHCDTNTSSSVPVPTPAPQGFRGNLDFKFPKITPKDVLIAGWCYDTTFQPGNGVPPMTVQIIIDGAYVVQELVANVDRGSAFPGKSGAPNSEHGYSYALNASWVATLGGKGLHRLDVNAYLEQPPFAAGAAPKTYPMIGSPACYRDGVLDVEACR